LNESKLTQAYCEYLLVTQTNYTLTYLAEHHEEISHDKITRYLRKADMSEKELWEKVQEQIIQNKYGYIIFDDTVLDKEHSQSIELVRRQYSGNAHGIIKGIGVVNCVYVNPETEQSWIIDYRIYNPEEDNKDKHSHVFDMLKSAVEEKKIKFNYVLMDTWYATKYLMLEIEKLGKIYYCPIKSNRLVDDSLGKEKYKAVNTVKFNIQELRTGKRIKIKDFPGEHKVQLFCVEVSTSRTDYIVTNSPNRQDIERVIKVSGVRWKIEQAHRELKQLTGMEKCQCRKAQSQKNHIACAMLVLTQLNDIAHELCTTAYRLKQGLLDIYMKQQLKNPSIKLTFA
jgi:SRSO17 transposase